MSPGFGEDIAPRTARVCVRPRPALDRAADILALERRTQPAREDELDQRERDVRQREQSLQARERAVRDSGGVPDDRGVGPVAEVAG